MKNWHCKDSSLRADTSHERRHVLRGNRETLSRLKTWEKHQLQTDFLHRFKIHFWNSCLQSCGNIPEGNPVPWQKDCFDHIDYKSRYRSQWQKLSISFLNAEPNLLTKTLSTWICEFVPTRTQKSQMTLMKCKFAVVNTYNSFSLLHQDQPAVRSVFSGFAEKAVDVGGLSQVDNVLVKVQIFTLMFLNCFVHPHSCQQTWIAKIFYFELQASTLTPFYYFFHVFCTNLLLMPKSLTIKYMFLRKNLC